MHGQRHSPYWSQQLVPAPPMLSGSPSVHRGNLPCRATAAPQLHLGNEKQQQHFLALSTVSSSQNGITSQVILSAGSLPRRRPLIPSPCFSKISRAMKMVVSFCLMAAGASGTGKTTFVNTLAFPPASARTRLSIDKQTAKVQRGVQRDEIHSSTRRCAHMVGSSHLIEALTVPTAAYSFNYEKLEVIGDTFLKFLATAYVFAENIESQERLLHYARREIIMIRTLLKHCMDHKLDDFMLH
ncbi:unnamed protein product [Tilletia controversa]|nr:unnamed protein product [Tilletia controversa]